MGAYRFLPPRTRDRLARQLRESCMAPGCSRLAVFNAAGTDLDGADFAERVCESCASYLAEGGATLTRLPSALSSKGDS